MLHNRIEKSIRSAAVLTALILALALALTGCGNSAGQDGNGSGTAKNSSPDSVIKARDIVEGGGEPFMYLYSNNISCKEADFSRNQEGFNGGYFVVSGLEDEAVQKKINDTIRNAFLELADRQEIPHYTGWKVRFRDMTETNRSVYARVYSDFNNLLSVELYSWRYFTREEGEISYGDSVTEIETLNFDLRTGELLTLKDLFRGDVDYLAFLDSYMEKYIAENDCYDDTDWSWESSISLSGPFRGVDPDQKFLLNDYTGTVSLLFDYNDPEVTSDYPVTVNVKDTSALDLDKFMEGGLAASDKTLHVRLARQDYRIENNPYEKEPIDMGGRNIDYRSQIASYSVLTEAQKRLLAERGEETLKAAKEMTDAYDGFRQRLGEERNIYANFGEEGDCSFYGPYRIISRYCYGYISPETFPGEEYEWYSTSSPTTYYVFKGDSDVPLDIEDIFKDGSDWKAEIRAAARKNLASMGVEPYFDFDSYADEYLGRLQGFYLDYSSLYLSFGDTSDIDSKYLADGMDNWYYSSCMTYLNFDHFGDCLEL